MFRRMQCCRTGVLVLLLCWSATAAGQLNNTLRDSLEQLLETRKGPLERLEPLRELAWSHLFSDKGLPYLQELDSLTARYLEHPDSTVHREILAYRSAMFYQRGYRYKFHRNMAAAQRDFRDALRLARDVRDTLLMANALSALGVSYQAIGLPDQALRYYDKELELILSTKERSTMYTSDIRQHKADALMRMGRFTEARSELLQCDTVAFDRQALTLMGLARLEAFKGDTTAALGLMVRAKWYGSRTPQPWDGIAVLEPMARLQLQAGHAHDALATATEAITLARSIGDEAALAGCLVIAGQAHMMLGDELSAERAFVEAMAIAERNGYIGLSRESGDDGSMLRAAEELKDLYKAQGRTMEALHMSELCTAWKDSIHTFEGRDELLRSDLQQAQLTDSIADVQRVLEATQELQTILEQERGQRRFTLTVGVFALCIVSFLIFYLMNRRKQERLTMGHELQRQEQERMIHDLRMRELMSDDLHEELGAGLSALKLWSEMDLAEETDPRRRQLLANRSAMANELVSSLRQIIWAMNSPTTTVKQLVDYLVDFAHLHCAQHGLRLQAECGQYWPTISLGPEQRRIPFLALKEVLNNTVKHSGADRVELRITWDGGLTIDVHDNGKGTTSAPEELPGNGLRNMKRRITTLGGHVRFDGSQGMRVHIVLPMKAGEHN